MTAATARIAVMSALALVLTACGGGGTEEANDGMSGGMDEGMAQEMDDGTGEMGGMLGGSAETTSLAVATLQELPQGPLAWSAFPVAGTEHSHAPGFVHAREATTLTIDGEPRELGAGEAVFVAGGVEHSHGEGSAWDVLLAEPDVAPPAGASGEAVFRSEVLEGLPEGGAELKTLLVEMPPGTETSVHEHPGPEFIYATSGPFIYASTPTGELTTREGDQHTLPARTAVQKRNPEDADTTAFLSWFVVEPDEPFASDASLGE